MTILLSRFSAACAALLLVCSPSVSQAQANPAAFCDAPYPIDSPTDDPSNGHNPQNVILIVLDDASSTEFPTLNTPYRWEDEDDPDADPDSIDEAGLRRPDLNRLAARVFATRAGCLDGNGNPVGTSTACLGPAVTGGELVVPVDLDDSASNADSVTAANFRYDTGSASADQHILKGFGGLAKLSREGVAYSRHYAPSGRCAPTRASIFTGRSHIDVGVSDNGAALKVQHITIADFLKQRGYRTGLIGKWHMRNGEDRSSWQRGFDETFHYEAPSRRHDKGTSLFCAPLRSDNDPAEPREYCTQAWGSGCTSDQSCNTIAAANCATDKCVCAPGWTGYPYTGIAGKCYLKQPPVAGCTSDADCAAVGGVCRDWGKYLGPEPLTARSGCHPDDIHNPLCCSPQPETSDGRLRADVYSFDKRTKNASPVPDSQGNTVGELFWKQDKPDGGSSHPCYSNDGSTFDLTTGGCRYDTRYFRDVAKNFIERNKTGPFFLYLALHGLHAPNSAPSRVEAHYKTDSLKSRAPASKDRFWAALEEIDAAIGQIMETVTDPAVGIADKTLVLLTSDQGRASSGFGEPAFKGGKGSISEGGVRVGLHAWGPGLGIVMASTNADTLAGGLTEHADLFATIAHASGCRPENEKGQYLVETCDDETRRACKPAGQCTANVDCCETGVECVSRRLAGQTLLPKLSSTVSNYSKNGSTVDPSIADRDVAFAQYIGSGYAIIARQGADALGLPTGTKIGICGAEGSVAAGDIPTGGVDPSPIDRERRGGSDVGCTPGLVNDPQNSGDPYDTSGDGMCTTQQTCTANGKFCVPKGGSEEDACTGDGNGCDWLAYPRCRGPKDCAESTTRCMPVKVLCTGCYEAQFKLRGKGGDNASNVDAIDLFDLRTNPEELESLNLVSSTNADIIGVRNNLRSRLGGWWDCVREHTTDGENIDCENCFESGSGICTPAD